MRIGLAQMDIVWENVMENKEKSRIFFEKARKNQVDLLIFPEMTLTGFSMNVEKTTRDWEDQLEWFKEMSVEYGMALVCGIAESRKPSEYEEVKADYIYKEDRIDSLYKKDKINDISSTNHLLIIENGEVRLDYAKIHPFSYGEESKHFLGGNKVCATDLKGIRTGAFVCYDLRFPEVFQISSDYSELIVVIANWPAKRVGHWDILLQARAIENQCYIAGVNRTGEGGGLGYNGHSAIYGPEGDRLNEILEGEELIVVDIDPDKVKEYRESFPAKRDRRRELYSRLTLQSILGRFSMVFGT